MKRMIGIDLGTSSSMIKTKEYPDGVSPEKVSLDCNPVVFTQQKMASTPTLIRERGKNRWYGYEAEQNPVKGSKLYQNFKTDLRSKDPQARERAAELTEDFFGFLYDNYAEQRQFLFDLAADASGDEETLVSYPAQWDEAQREAVLNAAREAGFINVRGMDEATASVHCILNAKKTELIDKGLLQADKPLNAVIIDMGAGTADLAFVRIALDGDLRTEILGTWPPADGGRIFGGSQMDELLAERMEKWLRDSGLGPDMTKNIVNGQSSAIKRWKELMVSPLLASGQAVDDCAAVSGMCAAMGVDLKPFPALDRERFAWEFQDYCKSFVWLLNSAPEELRNEVKLVILTGGNSQWYWIDEALTGANARFGQAALPQIEGHPERLLRMELPTETVSRGLVYSSLPLQIGQRAVPKPDREEKPEPEEAIDKSPSPNVKLNSESVAKRIAITFDQCLCVTSDGRVLSTTPLRIFKGEGDDSEHDYSKFCNIREVCATDGNKVLFKTRDGKLICKNPDDTFTQITAPDLEKWEKCRSYCWRNKTLLGVTEEGSVLVSRVCDARARNIHRVANVMQNIKQASLFGPSGIIGVTNDGYIVLYNFNIDSEGVMNAWIKDTFPELSQKDGGKGKFGYNISSIAVSDDNYTFVALKNDGRVECHGDVNQAIKERVKTWKSINRVGIDKSVCYGLTRTGSLYRANEDPNSEEVILWDCAGFVNKGIERLVVRTNGKIKFFGILPSWRANLLMSSWRLVE